MPERKIATKIRRLSGIGEKWLYRLTPPHIEEGLRSEDALDQVDYVMSSAIDALLSGPETYLFPADSDGNVLDWRELPGSFKGGLDCDAAVRDLGYEVVVALPGSEPLALGSGSDS